MGLRQACVCVHERESEERKLLEAKILLKKTKEGERRQLGGCRVGTDGKNDTVRAHQDLLDPLSSRPGLS